MFFPIQPRPGPRREVPLEKGAGIDVGARHRSGHERRDQVGEHAEPGLDDGVVVLAPRIAGDPGRSVGPVPLAVAESARDNRPGAGQNPRGIDPLVTPPLEVAHGAGVARVEPALEGGGVVGRVRGADGHAVEAQAPVPLP